MRLKRVPLERYRHFNTSGTVPVPKQEHQDDNHSHGGGSLRRLGIPICRNRASPGWTIGHLAHHGPMHTVSSYVDTKHSIRSKLLSSTAQYIRSKYRHGDWYNTMRGGSDERAM